MHRWGLLLGLVVAGCQGPAEQPQEQHADLAASLDTCDPRGGTLRQVSLFDGPIEEMAELVPDENGDASGKWLLESVYKAGRSAAVRCTYADGTTREVTLTVPVSSCDYTRAGDGAMTLRCR